MSDSVVQLEMSKLARFERWHRFTSQALWAWAAILVAGWSAREGYTGLFGSLDSDLVKLGNVWWLGLIGPAAYPVIGVGCFGIAVAFAILNGFDRAFYRVVTMAMLGAFFLMSGIDRGWSGFVAVPASWWDIASDRHKPEYNWINSVQLPGPESVWAWLGAAGIILTGGLVLVTHRLGRAADLECASAIGRSWRSIAFDAETTRHWLPHISPAAPFGRRLRALARGVIVVLAYLAMGFLLIQMLTAPIALLLAAAAMLLPSRLSPLAVIPLWIGVPITVWQHGWQNWQFGLLSAAIMLPLIMLSVRLSRGAHAWALQPVAPSASEVRARDPRAPVLLLRSFRDDDARFQRRDPTLPLSVPRRFEQELASELAGIGPIIAIGQPGEAMPRMGAAREYCPHDQWQDRVAELLTPARLAVIVVGATPGVAWEAQRVISHQGAEKLALVMPPVGSDELALRWAAFAAALGDAGPALGELPLGRTLVLARAAGRWIAIISGTRRFGDYRCAFRALGALIQPTPQATAAPQRGRTWARARFAAAALGLSAILSAALWDVVRAEKDVVRAEKMAAQAASRAESAEDRAAKMEFRAGLAKQAEAGLGQAMAQNADLHRQLDKLATQLADADSRLTSIELTPISEGVEKALFDFVMNQPDLAVLDRSRGLLRLHGDLVFRGRDLGPREPPHPGIAELSKVLGGIIRTQEGGITIVAHSGGRAQGDTPDQVQFSMEMASRFREMLRAAGLDTSHVRMTAAGDSQPLVDAGSRQNFRLEILIGSR